MPDEKIPRNYPDWSRVDPIMAVDEPDDDNTQDISVYDLAERVIAGRHVSEVGRSEIAARLHEMVRRLRLMLVLDGEAYAVSGANTPQADHLNAERLIALRERLLSIVNDS